ncbi:MAG TPA: shikimate kinase [Thermodesulfobacteriota bacterium]|nr:shikimate kinase [Deltaproteobacteria bacterium]HNR13212.1 shikimate kinase [Thermodesulfobacteriota bacterium]HOC37960.1 shikimate kinase [Thermodesulfobacteriota bacterium]
MNIVLIGYRGTGKSTVADLLAHKLQRNVVHMDREIVARTGASIPDIVAAYGWEHFRDIESELVQELARRNDFIIDAGGGVVVRQSNIQLLRNTGRLFWLKARPETIAERIRNDTERPSLSGVKTFLEEIEDILTERTPLYQQAADYELDTDRASPEEIAEEIEGMVQQDSRFKV